MRESGDRHEIMERTSDAGAARRVRKNKNAMIDREDTEGAGRSGWGLLRDAYTIVLRTGLVQELDHIISDAADKEPGTIDDGHEFATPSTSR